MMVSHALTAYSPSLSLMYQQKDVQIAILCNNITAPLINAFLDKKYTFQRKSND